MADGGGCEEDGRAFPNGPSATRAPRVAIMEACFKLQHYSITVESESARCYAAAMDAVMRIASSRMCKITRNPLLFTLLQRRVEVKNYPNGTKRNQSEDSSIS